MIEVGQNDMKLALTSLSYGDVVSKIPSMISQIELAMWVSESSLYAKRNTMLFFIHGISNVFVSYS